MIIFNQIVYFDLKKVFKNTIDLKESLIKPIHDPTAPLRKGIITRFWRFLRKTISKTVTSSKKIKQLPHLVKNSNIMMTLAKRCNDLYHLVIFNKTKASIISAIGIILFLTIGMKIFYIEEEVTLTVDNPFYSVERLLLALERHDRREVEKYLDMKELITALRSTVVEKLNQETIKLQDANASDMLTIALSGQSNLWKIPSASKIEEILWAYVETGIFPKVLIDSPKEQATNLKELIESVNNMPEELAKEKVSDNSEHAKDFNEVLDALSEVMEQLPLPSTDTAEVAANIILDDRQKRGAKSDPTQFNDKMRNDIPLDFSDLKIIQEVSETGIGASSHITDKLPTLNSMLEELKSDLSFVDFGDLEINDHLKIAHASIILERNKKKIPLRFRAILLDDNYWQIYKFENLIDLWNI